jgi:hypothetical protein
LEKILLLRPLVLGDDYRRSVDWGDWGKFDTPVGIYDRFPKAQVFLDNYFKVKNQCPDEANFQMFLKTWQNEIAENVEKERTERAELNKQQAILRSELQRVCQGIPKVSILQIERLSSILKVHPDSIKLSRLILKSDNLDNPLCSGIFYTPVGTKECQISFNSAGEVNSIGYCN